MCEENLRQRLKRAQVQKRAEAWRQSLSSATGYHVSANDHLAANPTNHLKQAFLASLRQATCQRMNCPCNQRDLLNASLQQLMSDVPNIKVVLFHNLDDAIGAVEIPCHGVLGHPFETWDVVGNDLTIVTPDLSSGLCLEMNYYDLTGEYQTNGVYEVAYWGVFDCGAFLDDIAGTDGDPENMK